VEVRVADSILDVNADVLLLLAEASSDSQADFRSRLRRRPGVRIRTGGDGLRIEIVASRIESAGPALEAAAVASGIVLRLAELDALVESAGLDGRPAGLWAAIGDAADRRSVERERGTAESMDLFEYVRVEERDGRRVAVDVRPQRVEPSSPPLDMSPTKFDDAGWHADSAEAAGQPPEHAWTHMALYLTWLIRNELVNTRMLGRDAQRVRDGDLVGAAVMGAIDAKLVPDFMADAGAEFSEANYGTYLETYDRLFAEEPDYSVAADVAAYTRVEPELDALWSIWTRGRSPASG
jgi:hypothetical protein